MTARPTNALLLILVKNILVITFFSNDHNISYHQPISTESRVFVDLLLKEATYLLANIVYVRVASAYSQKDYG
jgi:hypothetical protein